MDTTNLTRLRNAGKLEEMAAQAHDLDLYTTAGFSVHYNPSPAHSLSIPDLKPLIYAALAQVLQAFPTLFAVPIVDPGSGSGEKGETYFARLPSIDLRTVTSFTQRTHPLPHPSSNAGRDSELDALLQDQVNTNFKSPSTILPVWRFIALFDHASQEPLGFTANLMVHHALADGASLQILHRKFQKALSQLSSSPPTASQIEYTIPSPSTLTLGPCLESIHTMPLPIPSPAQTSPCPPPKDWLGNPTQVPSKTGYATLTLTPRMLTAFTRACKAHKVSTPAGLNALLTHTIFAQLPQHTAESMDINIPVDIRSELPPSAVDSQLGNYFDAFRTRILRADFSTGGSAEMDQFWAAASKIQKATRAYFARTAESGETYLNVAALKTVPDLRALLISMIGGPRSESLELAYIGPYVAYNGGGSAGGGVVWQAGKATVSRCAFALGACLQMTVVSHVEGMTVGFAWPGAVIEEGLVEGVIQGLWEYFVAITGSEGDK